MARRVDSEQHARQKAEIASAVWDLVARSGLESVSMSEVAKAAGVSVGRVQYYFGSKDALLMFGLKLAQERMEERIQARLRRLPEDVGAEEVLREAIYEVIGDNADTQQAIRVSVAYLPRATSDDRVAEVLFGDDPELLGFATEVVRQAQTEGRTGPDIEPEKEATIIWTIANGLGTEVAFGQTTSASARRTIDYHLARLLGRQSGLDRP